MLRRKARRTIFLFGYKKSDFYYSPQLHAALIFPMDVHLLERLLQVRMPFGKYKDRLIADLPGNYLNWFAREGFPQGELGRLLALMHELDHNGLKPLLEPLRARQQGVVSTRDDQNQ